MKTVILAGGLGTRISEESHLKPKPMVEIGEKPLLWHIMKLYSYYGFNDFIVCCGYKAYVIKEFFLNYYLYNSDISFDFEKGNDMKVLSNNIDPWKVTVVDTGLHTMTGGRIKRIQKYVGNEPFMVTYGDGLSDVNIAQIIDFHKKHGKTATLTAVPPEGRFGVLNIENDAIESFREKSKEDSGWINGGFMVLNPDIFEYIQDDTSIFEIDVLEKIAKENQLMAFKHDGFWRCMDTQRDKMNLENFWETGNAPWAVWE